MATARWKVSPLPSVTQEGLPGIGFPRWQVELLKVRNGNPGSFILEWAGDKFEEIKKTGNQPIWSELEDRQIG